MEDRRQATTRPSAHPSSIMLLFWSIICMLALQSRVNAFHPQVAPVFAKRPAITKLQLAREYIVIGGNLPGTNPDGDNTNNNMSKKERRRLEREKGEADFKSGKYKSKKKKKIIDYDKLEDKVTRERTLMPREQRELANKLNAKTNGKGNRLTEKAARLQRQRTAGGTINSTGETVLPQSPEEQAVLIRVAKRGNKVVTMVQGMTLPMKDRKELLKEMKAKLGGGGTLVQGVLELQGSHAEKVLEILNMKGYAKARVIR